MSDLYERSAAVMPPFALHKMPFGIDHAAGSYLYTDDGRKILDFGSGIAVNNLGHNYPTVVKAAHEQLDKMVHCCHNLFHYEVETALAERLVGLMGGGYKVYFSNSGMEDGKCPKQYFTQFDDIFKRLVDPYSVAAILMEPVQGEGGYVVPPREWVRYVRDICDKYGIMLIFDEVQTGFGRTGNMFAWQTHGVKPDIMSCAKGIANGLPLSAVVGRAEIMDKWTAGAHGGTFGANPVSCAAALATIDALEDGAIENGRRMGEYFIGELKKLQTQYPVIGDVRGLGLMIGMELVYPDGSPNRELTARIVALALEHNLYLLSCGCDKNVVRFIAPLTVAKEEIDYALSVLDQVFEQAANEA